MRRNRYLVLGATGVIGRYLYRLLGPDRAVFTSCRVSVPNGIRFDATTMRLCESALPALSEFSHAFVLVGNSNIDSCARDSAAAYRVNGVGVKRVIDDLVAAGVTPVFASSDMVFDGQHGGRTETDVPSPILTYGKHKLEVERYLTALPSPSAIVRLSKVVDPDAIETDWLGAWLGSLERGEEIRAAHDQIFCPVSASDVADGLCQLAENGCTGLFHMGGPEPCSRWELAQRLARAARLYLRVTPKIVRCSIRDFPFLEPRPLNVSMSSAKLYSAINRTFLGIDPLCHCLINNRFGLRAAVPRHELPSTP